MATPVSSNGGGAGGGSRFKVMLRGGSKGPRNDTPTRLDRARSAVDAPVSGAAYGGGGEWVGGGDGRALGNSGGGRGGGGGEQWMNAHHHQYPGAGAGAGAPYNAPTAPYRGEDGVSTKGGVARVSDVGLGKAYTAVAIRFGWLRRGVFFFFL